ncbi:Mu transposase domain-containing protein, partial [Segatella salivae]
MCIRDRADDCRQELLRIAVQAPLQCFPKEHVGKRVTILFDADMVEIYCGMNLVAIHDRCDIPYTYSWKKEHNL